MKIRAADSTSVPIPQFVVEAENETDRQILKAFCQVPHHTKNWQFRMHGYVGQSDIDGVTSFNFGWVIVNENQ